MHSSAGFHTDGTPFIEQRDLIAVDEAADLAIRLYTHVAYCHAHWPKQPPCTMPHAHKIAMQTRMRMVDALHEYLTLLCNNADKCDDCRDAMT